MNDYNNFHENYLTASSQGEPYTAPEGPSSGTAKTRSPLTRGAAVAIACAGVLTSSLLGFGGGYVAARIPTEPDNGPAAAAPAASVSTIPETASEGMSVSQVVSSVSDSVVEINTEMSGMNFMMQTVTAQAAGSGVIISTDGYIVTNNHVIEDAQNITVRLSDGESHPAKLIGSDAKTDLAVIKIEAQNLKAAPMGSSSSLTVGDEAVAIGNPLGELGGTVTNGIISALDREISLGNETMTLLQTNAAINHGNSGGGLFNNKGELIGIVVAKSSGNGIEGLGFAIPIDSAKNVINDLIDTGYVTGRGELGISVIDIQDQQTAFMYRVPQYGVYVANVNASSAAQAAGLKVGDGITAINDTKVTSSQELKAALGKCSANERVTLTVLRDGENITLSAVLSETIPEEAAKVKEA